MAFLRLNQPGITNLTPHQGNRDWLISRKPGGGSAPVDPRLAFHALENRQGVIIGEGALSASTGSTTIYAPDASGVYQPFTDEPVWEGVDWLKYQPLAINSATYSRDLSNAVWTQAGVDAPAADKTGIDGTANTAWSLTDSDAGAMAYVNHTTTLSELADAPITLALWIGKETGGVPHYPEIQHRVNNSSVGIVQIDLNTGAIVGNRGSVPDAQEVISVGNFWKVLIQKSAAAAITSAQTRIYPAMSNTPDAAEATATGTTVIGQFEIHANKTLAEVRGLGPIFTTTDAASTAATAYSWEQVNQNNTSGVWFYELASGIGAGDIGPPPWWDEYYLRFGSAHGYNPYADGIPMLGFRSQPDGGGNGNTGKPAITLPPAGTMMKVGSAYSGGETSASTTIDGITAETLTTFHSLGHETALAVGRPAGSNVRHPFSIRNVRRYDITSYAEGKEIIDGLMA